MLVCPLDQPFMDPLASKQFAILYTSLYLVPHTQLSTRIHQNVKKQFLTRPYTACTHLKPPPNSATSVICTFMLSLLQLPGASLQPHKLFFSYLHKNKNHLQIQLLFTIITFDNQVTQNRDGLGWSICDQYVHMTCFQSCSVTIKPVPSCISVSPLHYLCQQQKWQLKLGQCTSLQGKREQAMHCGIELLCS